LDGPKVGIFKSSLRVTHGLGASEEYLCSVLLLFLLVLDHGFFPTTGGWRRKHKTEGEDQEQMTEEVIIGRERVLVALVDEFEKHFLVEYFN